MKIEVDEKCPSCKGTGLYVGLTEHGDSAVVCHTCKGTGCHHFVHEYDEFAGRITRLKVYHVIETNPGVVVGVGGNSQYTLQDFGGMPYADWLAGKPFTQGMEMRQFTCPAWWYQAADYGKKPEWDKCDATLGGTFSSCTHFRDKSQCWAQFDVEELAARTA